ncbi:conserved protein, unknown function [Hepatocystis sp. ex Piliocolobus tephrosceles]|nr:conserved protein, unknown function [Hepatocystis sp. ex Piliocolobus tephrosceles]
MSKKKKNIKKQNLSKYYNPYIITAILLGSIPFFYNIIGPVYVIIVLIVAIFVNLDYNNNDINRNNSISAYSIFNKSKKYLIGDLRMNKIDSELRNTYKQNCDDSDDNFLKYDDVNRNKIYIKGSSKYNNKLCTCGSKKKFKKCCGLIKDDSSDF